MVLNGAPRCGVKPTHRERSGLFVWVIGNPTSGHHRGRTVLRRLEEFFRQSYGDDVLHDYHDGPATSPSLGRSGDGLPNGCRCTTSTAAAAAANVRVVMMETRRGGDERGFARVASQTAVQQRLEAAHGGGAANEEEETTLGCGGEVTSSPERQRASPVAHGRTPRAVPRHVIVVVGGDGTLGEVVSGLCEGTLSAFERWSGFASVQSRGLRTAHHRMKREKLILSSLLPEVLYVPGGTGADFAKLSLCCPTPEAAMGVLKSLIAELTASVGGGEDSAEKDARCSACLPTGGYHTFAVDVGRLYFPNTGHVRYFINEASTGMSCDVVARGEAFKKYRIFVLLGGLILFAASSLVSLFLMSPKPIFIAKLPSSCSSAIGCRVGDGMRTPASAKSPQLWCNGEVPSFCPSSTPAAEEEKEEEADPIVLLQQVLWYLDHDAPLALVSNTATSSTSVAGMTTSDPDERSFSPIVGQAGGTFHGEGGSSFSSSLPHVKGRLVRCTTSTPAATVQRLLDIDDMALQAHQQGVKYCSPAARPPNETAKATAAASRDFVDDGEGLRWRGTGVSGAVTSVDDELHDGCALQWVELPSSTLAFANGRWYGGGLLVAPHGNPMDGLLSCTNWVTTVFHFISGVVSLYNGHHVHWSCTHTFDGERFIISDTAPTAGGTDLLFSEGGAVGSSMSQKGKMRMEADGELLEELPAVVEIGASIPFLAPAGAVVRLGVPAPGTTRAGSSADGRVAKGVQRGFLTTVAHVTTAACSSLYGSSLRWMRRLHRREKLDESCTVESDAINIL